MNVADLVEFKHKDTFMAVLVSAVFALVIIGIAYSIYDSVTSIGRECNGVLYNVNTVYEDAPSEYPRFVCYTRDHEFKVVGQ